MTFFRLLCASWLLGAAAAPAAPSSAPASDGIASAAPANPVNLADGQRALGVLRELLAAYAKGQSAQAEALLEPQMIGYAQLADALREGATRQKQLRIGLSDTRTQLAPDLVVIQTRWEKRFLALPGLTPQRRTGHSTFVMRREEGRWRLSAAGGDALISAD